MVLVLFFNLTVQVGPNYVHGIVVSFNREVFVVLDASPICVYAHLNEGNASQRKA